MKRGFIKIFIRIKNIGFYVKWYYSVIDLIICKRKIYNIDRCKNLKENKFFEVLF